MRQTAEDINNDGVADYEEARYKVTYANKIDTIGATMPVDNGAYLANTLAVLSDTVLTGTYNGKAVTLVGWTKNASDASKVYANINDELYGEDRLLALLNANKEASMEELCKLVKEDVFAFAGEAPQFDDITMLALKYCGATAPTNQEEAL